MNGWMDQKMEDEWINGCMNEWMIAWMDKDEWINNECLHGCMDAWMIGWLDEWMNG